MLGVADCRSPPASLFEVPANQVTKKTSLAHTKLPPDMLTPILARDQQSFHAKPTQPTKNDAAAHAENEAIRNYHYAHEWKANNVADAHA